MHLATLLYGFISSLTAVTAAPANNLPQNTSNGIYPDHNSTKTPSIRDLGPVIVQCSNRDLIGDWESDLKKAVTGLDHFCPNTTIAGHSWYRTRWEYTQIYYCNYAQFYTITCSSDEYWEADKLFDDKCGRGKGAWLQNHEGKSIGRDPTKDDMDFRSECGYW